MQISHVSRKSAEPIRLGTSQPRKKITLSRFSNVPRVTIKVDQLIKDTYHDLATGKLRNLLDSRAPSQNELLLEYIREVYELYDIPDPMLKYKQAQNGETRLNQSTVRTPILHVTIKSPPTPTSANKNIIQSVVYEAQPNASRLNLTKITPATTNTRARHMQEADIGFSRFNKADDSQNLTGIHSSSKCKLSRLKQSFKEHSEEPVDIRVIKNNTGNKGELNTTSKKRTMGISSTIKKQIMFATPGEERKRDYASETKPLYTTGVSLQDTQQRYSRPPGFQPRQAISVFDGSEPRINSNTLIEGSQEQIRDHIAHRSAQLLKKKTSPDFRQQIPQVFRYCFMCEAPILEANILAHETKCPDFGRLYQISAQQIISELQTKIKRMRQEIENMLGESHESQQDSNQNQATLRKIEKIKNSVKDWIKVVGRVQQDGQIRDPLHFQKSYQGVIESFSAIYLRILDVSHKLRWFIQIRDHIKQRLHI